MNLRSYLFTLALVFGLANYSFANYDRVSVVYGDSKNQTIFIEGNIGDETLEQIEFATRGWIPNTVVISSGGGVTAVAIELAKIIRKWNATLVVDGFCFSACANYLFTGARLKVVLPFSVVGVHSISSRPSNPSGKTPRSKFEQPIETELSFLSDIGIKGILNDEWADFHVRSETPDSDCKGLSAGGFFPPLSDWLDDGVTGIVKFWYPRSEEEIQLLAKRFRLARSEFAFLSVSELRKFCFRKSKVEVNSLR
jgi:hypothetical protein